MTDVATVEMIEPKTKRAGNPLMRSCTDADLTNNQEFVFQKLDSVFKNVEDETLLTPILWKKYLEWRKDSGKREKFAAIQKLKATMAELGLGAGDLA